MFHVEHMKMLNLALTFVFFVILGCNKPDPNAYMMDPILKDYQSQLATTTAASETVKKQLADAEKELKGSIPQSGQATIHRKRVAEMKNRVDQLEQQIHFWRIRIESRAKDAQLEYLKSREKKEPWPDTKSVDSYHAQKRLRLSKLAWDNKERIEKSKDESKKVGPEQAH